MSKHKSTNTSKKTRKAYDRRNIISILIVATIPLGILLTFVFKNAYFALVPIGCIALGLLLLVLIDDIKKNGLKSWFDWF